MICIMREIHCVAIEFERLALWKSIAVCPLALGVFLLSLDKYPGPVRAFEGIKWYFVLQIGGHCSAPMIAEMPAQCVGPSN